MMNPFFSQGQHQQQQQPQQQSQQQTMLPPSASIHRGGHLHAMNSGPAPWGVAPQPYSQHAMPPHPHAFALAQHQQMMAFQAHQQRQQMMMMKRKAFAGSSSSSSTSSGSTVSSSSTPSKRAKPMVVDLTDGPDEQESKPQSPDKTDTMDSNGIVTPPSPSRKNNKHLIPPSPSTSEDDALVGTKCAPVISKSMAARKSRKMLPYKKRRPSLSTRQRCTSESSPSSSGPRRVRFQQDPASKRIVRKVIYGRATLTEEEKKLLWWDKQIKRSTKRAIRRYQSSSSAHRPQQQPRPNSSDDSDEDERSVTSLSRHDFAEKYREALELCASSESMPSPGDIPTISDTPIRGLEHRIFPETVNARQEVISKVVASQRKLPKGLTPDQQGKLLRKVSQSLTRSSRMLARLYGLGDEQVASVGDVR